MKTVFKSILAAATIALMASSAQAANSLEDLLQEVKKNRVSEARINKEREAEFQSARADKQALLRKAQADLKAERSREDRLKKAFFIIFAAYATTVVAMLPLWFAGAGLLKGFALTTIAGVTIGVFITRPAFAAVVEVLLKKEE